MAGYQAVSFDDSHVSVVGRDDGRIALEMRTEGDALEGIVLFDADTAVAIGKLLVVKGQNALDVMQAQADDAPAWRDRNGKVWFGEKDSDRMHPAGADTDQADHSWEELDTYFGPLTPVKIDQ